MLIAIVATLAFAILVNLSFLVRSALATKASPTLETTLLGAVVNFFDTLGIGSFAPTAAWLKFRKLVPDRLIPPTMLVGLTPPVMAESVIFLILLGVKVDVMLLVGSALATMIGGIAGAPLVARARVWVVQMVLAFGLALAAIAYVMTNLHLFPGGGEGSGLPFGLAIVAVAASFVMGVLANFGVGNYAPMLVMLSLMGMDPRLCFPIMALGGSLMGATASIRHMQIGQVDMRVVLGLALGGIPAVLVAALIVKSMPIEILRWMVVVVVLYSAAVLFRAAVHGRREHRAEGVTAAVAAP
jgi:uncharacterized membrane protein YfcA